MLGRTADVRRLAIALLVSAAALLVVAAPAGAYLRNLTVKNESTGTNSNSPKSDLVPVTGCPGPIIGGAAFVSPGLPNLGLTQLMPFGGLLTGARETDSESASWSLLSRAFCVENTTTTPNGSGTPASYLKALQYFSTSGANNSSPIKSATAKCPAGKTAIGGGGRIAAATSDYAFTAFQRAQANTAWRVSAHEVDQTNANWRVTALAICADVSSASGSVNYLGNATPGGGLYQQQNPPSSFNSVSPKSIVRTCPAGSYVIGGGARVAGNGFDDPAPSDVVITRSSLGQVNQWIAEARETDPTNSSWRLNAHISCAPLNGAP